MEELKEVIIDGDIYYIKESDLDIIIEKNYILKNLETNCKEVFLHENVYYMKIFILEKLIEDKIIIKLDNDYAGFWV